MTLTSAPPRFLYERCGTPNNSGGHDDLHVLPRPPTLSSLQKTRWRAIFAAAWTSPTSEGWGVAGSRRFSSVQVSPGHGFHADVARSVSTTHFGVLLR